MVEQALVHVPVMMEEVLRLLAPRPGGIYLDCTFGHGGHSRALLERAGEKGRVIALDQDPWAVAEGRRLAAREPRFSIAHSAFSDLDTVTRACGVYGKVDGALFDLGVCSSQLDEAGRGFSFRGDGPLDMRMNPETGPSARQWLASAPERDIARVIKDFGEERYARRIARAIVAARSEDVIETTTQLAEIVRRAVPPPKRGSARRRPGAALIHPATRTFQAIRIHINRELEEVDTALHKVVDVLAPGGRLAVISFHSLEDRIVKRFIRDQSRPARAPRGLPLPEPAVPPALKLAGKLQRPAAAEVAANPRARSALLRGAEKCA